MQKYKLKSKILLACSLMMAALFAASCSENNNKKHSDASHDVSVAAPSPKSEKLPASLIERLMKAQDSDVHHRAVVEKFIKDVWQPGSSSTSTAITAKFSIAYAIDTDDVLPPKEDVHLHLLRARNSKQQNALHFLLSKGTVESIKTAKLVYDLDKELIDYVDSFGKTPVDNFAASTTNLTNKSQFDLLVNSFGVDPCKRMSNSQDTLLHKIARVTPGNEQRETLVSALEHGGLACIDRVGDGFDTVADLAVAGNDDGKGLDAIFAAKNINSQVLDDARVKKLKLALTQKRSKVNNNQRNQQKNNLASGTQSSSTTASSSTYSSASQSASATPVWSASSGASQSRSSTASLSTSSSASHSPAQTIVLQIPLIQRGNYKFDFTNINTYEDGADQLDQTAIDQIANFLTDVLDAAQAATLVLPQSYGAGQHTISGNIYDLPRVVRVISAQKIVIELRKVVYVGTDKQGHNVDKIFSAFDPINGISLVKREADPKNFVELNEFRVYEELNKTPREGLVEVHSTLVGQPKNLIFMKRYSLGSLQDILDDNANSRQNFESHDRLEVISSILKGLENFHAIEMKGLLSLDLQKSVKLSHRDLKPGNIFCDYDGAIKCAIGDFDTAVNFDILAGTQGFFAPLAVEFFKTYGLKYPQDKINNLNIDHGQKFDMWAMGMMIANILKSEDGNFDDFLPAITNSFIDQKTFAIGQAVFTADSFIELASDWEDAKLKSNELDILRAWDVARQMLQADERLRPDATTALHLLANKAGNYVMGQYFQSLSTVQAKKVVGGLYHYCFIDMTDHVRCRDMSNSDARKNFPGLQHVAAVPTAVSTGTARDLIAGPYNTCAIMSDDTLQCFGRDDGINDMTLLNGIKVNKVVMNQTTVIATDVNDDVMSSPKRTGIVGLNFPEATTVWAATDEKIYWMSNSDTDLQWLSLNNPQQNKRGFSNYVLPKGPARYFGKAGRMFATTKEIFGFTTGAASRNIEDFLFSTMPQQKFDLSFKENNFYDDIVIAHKLVDGKYESFPYFRLRDWKQMASGQHVVDGAWISRSVNDPASIIGDDDGTYDDIAIGETYRCFLQHQTLHCDHGATIPQTNKQVP